MSDTMTLEQQINNRMKDAMRAKDGPTKDLMRMIKSKVTEQLTSKSYKGAREGDELWLNTIEAYVKTSQKALADYEALGEEGAAHSAQVRWEIEALKVYDRAYAGLTQDGRPAAFREFLLDAPHMFIRLGEQVGAVQHIVSFWNFRFNPRSPRVQVEELIDIFMDFEASLAGRNTPN